MYWQDGRTVPDTTQSLIEFPNGENMLFDATLVSGFDAMYDLYFGSDSTIILRDNKAWMFKEVDAPQLGWEVYARKDKFYKETGIALLANATKLDAMGPILLPTTPMQKHQFGTQSKPLQTISIMARLILS